MSPEFEKQVVDLLPKLRSWAWYLTRDVTATEDLVQDAALKALLAFESFTPGTNFPAWVRRIMYNHFISGVRQTRAYTTLNNMPEIAVAETQPDQINIREAGLAFNALPQQQKDALRAIVLQDRPYEEASRLMGISIGTLKSRVHRARLQLRDQSER